MIYVFNSNNKKGFQIETLCLFNIPLALYFKLAEARLIIYCSSFIKYRTTLTIYRPHFLFYRYPILQTLNISNFNMNLTI